MVVPLSFPEQGSGDKAPSAPAISSKATRPTDPQGITFQVGKEGHLFVIDDPRILSSLSVYIIRQKDRQGNRNYNDLIEVHCEKENFEKLLGFLHGVYDIASVEQALPFLQLSVDFEQLSLCGVAVFVLDHHLNPVNVLSVMRVNIPLYMILILHAKYTPGFHTFIGLDKRVQIKSLIDNLQNNCLIVSGTCSKDIIQSEEFATLDIETARNILTYMNIQIKDEMILFSVIAKLYNKYLESEDCDKNNEVLHDLIFLVRYGLMSEKQFVEGPVQSGLLDQTDVDKILNFIRNPKSCELTGHLKNIGRERSKDHCDLKPYPMSFRTMDRTIHLRKEDTKKNKKRNKEKEPSKFLLCWLRCWQMIFD